MTNPFAYLRRNLHPPVQIVDQDKRGVYLLEEPGFYKNEIGPTFLRAALALRVAYPFNVVKNMSYQAIWLKENKETKKWEKANVGKCPWGWRLNFPLPWRPLHYTYCRLKDDVEQIDPDKLKVFV